MLCHTFRTIAHQTWDKLAIAKSVGHQISEQAFTDFNLLEMKIRHPKEVTIKTFSSREESCTGADWELWIRSKKNSWVGFRIQAKVINLSTDKYECLHYRSKSKKDSSLQSEKLIHSAFRSQHKLFPIYCLYSFWEHSNYPKFYKYTCSKGSAEHFGCSFVDAFTILELENDGTKHIKDIFPFMSPWSDLVCCSSKDDLAIHAHKECKSWCTNSLNNTFFL